MSEPTTWEKICEADKHSLLNYQHFTDGNGWCDPPLPRMLALPFTHAVHLRLEATTGELDDATTWRMGHSLIQHAHQATLDPDPARIIEHGRTIALKFTAPIGAEDFAHALLRTYWDWDEDTPAHAITVFDRQRTSDFQSRPDHKKQWPNLAETLSRSGKDKP